MPEKRSYIWLGAGSCILVGLLVGAAAGWKFWHRDNSPDPKRWAQVKLETKDGFDELLKKEESDWSVPHLSAYSIAATKPPRAYPTLKDLSDHGQAWAIDYLAKSTKDAPHLWSDVLATLADPNDRPASENDPFKFDRTLVATVTKGAEWLPGDRMVWTRIFIQPQNFAFAGYTIAATDNETVKIASIEATSTRKLSADLELTNPEVEGPKATAGASSEKTVKSTSDINAQYERLGIDIERDFLRIVRESETGGDVLGNTTVALSVVTDPAMLYGHRGDPVAKDKRVADTEKELVLVVTEVNVDERIPGSAKAKDAIVVLPQPLVPHCPLKATVWMLYEERRIDSDRDHYAEGGQNVTLLRSFDPKKPVELIPADEVSPAVWSIQVVPASVQPLPADKKPEPESAKFVHAYVENGQMRELVFTDFGRASRLAHELRLKSIDFNGKDPGAMLSNLNFDYEKGDSFLPFKTSNDECEKGYIRSRDRGHYTALPDQTNPREPNAGK